MPSTRWVRTALLGPRARFSLARSYAALERLIFAAAIGADPQTKLANRRDTGESEHALGSRHRACSVRSRNHINAHHGVGAGLSCTSTPGPHRRAKERGWHQASSGQPPGGSETPYCFTPRHWAAALGSLPLGRVLLPSPLGPSTVKRPESRSRVEVGAASAASRPGDERVPQQFH